jgi:hypothetical protein
MILAPFAATIAVMSVASPMSAAQALGYTPNDSMDYAGVDTNLYSYVGNQPTTLTEPTGNLVSIVAGGGSTVLLSASSSGSDTAGDAT